MACMPVRVELDKLRSAARSMLLPTVAQGTTHAFNAITRTRMLGAVRCKKTCSRPSRTHKGQNTLQKKVLAACENGVCLLLTRCTPKHSLTKRTTFTFPQALKS
jgi:hypothetical protein